MADSPNLRALARQLAALQGEMHQIHRSLTAEQMKYSSVDDGAVIEKDATGGIVSRWGKQHDGTHGAFTLDGPIPPTPEPPVLEGENGALSVTWTGGFLDDRRVPMDFQTVQIGLTDTDDGPLGMVGVITSEAGGSKTMSVKPGTYWVALRTRAQSGRASAWSERVAVEVEPIGVDQEVLDEINDRLDRNANAFTTSDREPTAADADDKPDGAYWTQINTDGAQVARWRLTGGEWTPAPLGVQFIPEIGADKIDVNSLAASTGFLDEVFSRNLNLSGELTALSPDFTTILSQAGVQMFANSSLTAQNYYTVQGDRRGARSLASTGDAVYVMTSPSTGSQGQNHIYRHDAGHWQLLSTITSAAGWRFSRITLTDDHLICTAAVIWGSGANQWRVEVRSLSGALQSSFTTTEAGADDQASEVAAHDGVIAVAKSVWLDDTYTDGEIYIQLYDHAGAELARTESLGFPGGGGINGLAMDDSYVYVTHLTAGGSTREILRFDRTDLTPAPSLPLPAGPSAMTLREGTLWATLQQAHLMIGYDTTTAAPVFVGGLSEGAAGEFGWNADGTEAFVLRTQWHDDGSNQVRADRYAVSSEPNTRVSIDNFSGKLIAQELESEDLYVRGTRVTPITRYVYRDSGVASPLLGNLLLAESVVDIDEFDNRTIIIFLRIGRHGGFDVGRQNTHVARLAASVRPNGFTPLSGIANTTPVTLGVGADGTLSLRWCSHSISNTTNLAINGSYTILAP